MPDRQRLETLGRIAHYHPAEFAESLGWSEWRLRRRFRRVLGCSPRAWLNELRTRDTEAWLRGGQLAKNAASLAGFNHPASFSRWFRAQKDMTVSAFAALAVAHASGVTRGSANLGLSVGYRR
jgi:AraC-like DNA-binding protein